MSTLANTSGPFRILRRWAATAVAKRERSGDLVDSYQSGLLDRLSCWSPVGVRVERILC